VFEARAAAGWAVSAVVRRRLATRRFARTPAKNCRARCGTYCAEDAGAKLVLCGHTHMPRAIKLVDGRFIVNTGSVGLQAYSDAYPFAHTIEPGSPHARYAIVTEQEGE